MKHRSIVLFILILATAGILEAGFSGTEVYLPSVGSGPGAAGSHWRTSLWLHNPGTTTANVTLELLARGSSNPAPATAYEVVGPGETIRIPDLVAAYFGGGTAFGALRVTATAKVLVASRIHSTPAGAGEEASAGQFFGGVPAAFAIGQGERTRVLGAFQWTPSEAGPFRTNFGFVETGGGNVTVRVTVRDGADPASVLGQKDYTLGPWGVLQKNLADVVTDPHADNAVLEIEVLSGSTGRVLAFGSQVANGSNDPSTLEMQFADSLLGSGTSGGGLAAVAHDGTLTGDGTSSAPLGVADRGITAAKLSAAGSSAGQVLVSDGSAVRWQTPSGGGGGLSLPYAATVSASGDGFAVTNDGGGRALFGRSTGHDGVTGKSEIGGRSGVFGSNTEEDGYGVFGRNYGSSALGFLAGRDTVFDMMDTAVGALGRADGTSGAIGVVGLSSGGRAVAGKELQTGNFGLLGTGSAGVTGVAANTSPTVDTYAVWGIDNTGGVGFAGVFTGDVAVSGNLDVQGSKNFRIDHPLDPENRYLVHAAIESDEVLDQYTGNVVLGADGSAWVQLPDWFESINTDFRYQLTPVGAPAPGLYVAEEIRDGRFRIAGGRSGLTVSWLVTARRNDRHMRAHPFRAERPKPERLRGSYLDPEAWGQPPERSEAWVAHPETMRRLEASQEREARRAGSEVAR